MARYHISPHAYAITGQRFLLFAEADARSIEMLWVVLAAIVVNQSIARDVFTKIRNSGTIVSAVRQFWGRAAFRALCGSSRRALLIFVRQNSRFIRMLHTVRP